MDSQLILMKLKRIYYILNAIENAGALSWVLAFDVQAELSFKGPNRFNFQAHIFFFQLDGSFECGHHIMKGWPIEMD